MPDAPATPADRTGPSLTRLPFEVREEVCRRLHDAQTADQINAWLATLGYGPFWSSAFTKFKQSRLHHQAWLEQQERLEEKRARADKVRRELAAKLEAAKFEFQKATALHQILSDEIARERARAIVADSATSKADQIAALVELMNKMEQEEPE